tara:strand:- start:197 stop:388 length:192 start_codon:yes stop_codon:yes gene_type:complete
MADSGKRKEIAAGKQVSFTLTADDVKVINKYKSVLEREFGITNMSPNKVARALMTRAVRSYEG